MQKAKCTYLNNSDRCTKFFHDLIKRNFRRNKIVALTDRDGSLCTTQEDISFEFVSHYRGFLGASIDRCNLNIDWIRCGPSISTAHHTSLAAMVTIEEVKTVVFGIDNGKAPGPDGFGAMFFKRSWDIIGSDVFAAVTDPPRCVLQIDLQKAFDTVSWEFLREALHALCFSDIFIAWVMECVSTTSFSVMVNGQLQGLFQGRCGLRQGDPLSPFLFTICMEVFARGAASCLA
ncbi:hypothetical protein F511_11971 [Dorcoceras hygrometricum]|uniref:Reverse transcriptase domain-containing protein n=1 Tax=Dorcoceras hygrometricum TaxID=472368 RepID=A0A2Z7CL65_9LAMI|nr:hypothetical protein F511_11971 [Dorcoceras hygrometricum]